MMDEFKTAAVFWFGLLVTVLQAAMAVLQGTDVISGDVTTVLLVISAVATAIVGYLTHEQVHAVGRRALDSTPPAVRRGG